MTRWSMVLAAVVAGGLVLGCGQSSERIENGNQAEEATGKAGTSAPAGGQAAPGGMVTGTVEETMDSGGYTYVRVATADGSVWAAAPQFAVETGTEVTFSTGMPMRGYHSSTLDRTFDLVYFTQAIEPAGHAQDGGAMTGRAPSGHPSTEIPQVEMEPLAAPDGGLTIAQVFAQRAALGGKEVVVHGKVVKYNAGIMGRNWIHIQDGTGMIGGNDLTVTTDAETAVGNMITVKGTVALDKDFGAGYAYDVILENATLLEK